MGFLIAAITLGLLGSFHCIGMCGPIALSLPIHGSSGLKKLILILIYNSGRIITYSFFGLLAGLVGTSIAWAGYQQFLSVTLGTLILLSILLPKNYKSSWPVQAKIYSLFSKVKNHLAKLFLREGKKSLFMIGLLNGLLPCGLVYMGIAGAIATGDILQGVMFMAVFGSGTSPVMILLPFAGNFFSIKRRNVIRKTVPFVTGLMALLLILRGLNLGIPYVSPKMDEPGLTPSCHTQSTLYPKSVIKCPVPHKN